MPGRMSLPVEDPDEPDRPKGFRSVEEDTLGPGNHLNREGKKMVLLVYEAFRDDLIRVNTKLVKKRIGDGAISGLVASRAQSGGAQARRSPSSVYAARDEF